MVYLNRIYTKSGDDGTTALGDGTRVSKTHPRITAYGGVDELNAHIGWAATLSPPEPLAARLRIIQNELFDLGADLCVPQPIDEEPNAALRVTAAQVTQLEAWIDEANGPLPALTSFILPGGSPLAAALHIARTVCRRIEIGVIELSGTEPINEHVLHYLNRLSDLLFVYCRAANLEAGGDVLWQPGSTR